MQHGPKSQRIIIVCLGACVLTVVGYAYMEFRRKIGAVIGPAASRPRVREHRGWPRGTDFALVSPQRPEGEEQ